MLTVDLTLEYGKATAQVEDSNNAPVGSAVTLSSTPNRLSLASGQSINVSGDGKDIYRFMVVHSGTSDSGTIEVTSSQGKYHLKPSVVSRLGNSVVVEDITPVTIKQFVAV